MQALIDFQTSAQENTITITVNEIKRIILRDDSMIDSVSVGARTGPSGLADTDFRGEHASDAWQSFLQTFQAFQGQARNPARARVSLSGSSNKP